MNFPRPRLSLLFLSALLVLQGRAAEPLPDGLADFLGKQGYGRVELKRVSRPARDRPGKGNNLYLDVQADGRKQKWLLDTGCSITSFGHSAGRRFKTMAELQRQLADPILGTVEGANFVLIHQLQLGSLRLSDQPAMVRDLDNRRVYSTEDALLGIDLMRRHHAVIDFQGRGLYLRTIAPDQRTTTALDELLRRSGWGAVTLHADHTLCQFVEMKVGEEPLRLLVDSGGEFTQLDLTAAKRLKLKLNPLLMSVNGTADRRTQAFVTQISLVQLAGLTRTNEPVVVADLSAWQPKSGASFEGIVGADWLALGRAILDCQSGRLYLRPVDQPAK